jgi:hypothetical protein
LKILFIYLDSFSPLQMHQSLETRLATAEEMRKAAEQEMLEKEESARNALAEQEAIMEKVVQESKILKEEAEENSKVATFLTHHGPFQLTSKYRF